MRNFLTVLFICLAYSCSSQNKNISLQQKDGKVIISVDGDLFTEYVHGERKPYLYPVIGPNGLSMTRNFPMKKGVAGESQDHPWQTSVFYTHGSVNGLDFWNGSTSKQKACKILLNKIEKAENLSSDKAVVVATHKWVNNEKTIMTDKTEITFSANDTQRFIDYKITLIASHGNVVLGDTKEGCMAVRMNHKLRVKGHNARVVNSAGVSGKKVWGKKAKWISYHNDIDGKATGITMMDHPQNLRYPTTWHARDYGLCAANPFGLKHFTRKKGLSGSYTIKSGESLTFTYRLIFFSGPLNKAQTNDIHNNWKK